MPGVTIIIHNTTRATVTYADGSFIFKNINPDDTLVITYDKYIPIKEPVNGRDLIMIEMKKALPEIVRDSGIVNNGYWNSDFKNISGSLITVPSDVFENTNAFSLEECLVGRAPGVFIRRNDGQPGSGIAVRIRGVNTLNNNEPLWVVDGIILNAGLNLPDNYNGQNPLSDMHPEDIESVTVLKDASATAIYGSRGANGVILITTKKGFHSGIKIAWSGIAGFQLPETKINTMKMPDYSLLIDEIFVNSLNQPGSVADLKNYNQVNWQDEIYQTGKLNKHFVSVRGGNKNNIYSISGNINFNKGILARSNQNLFGLRLNDEINLGTWFKAGINLNFNNKYGSAPNSGNDLSSQKPVISALKFPPFIPLNETGAVIGYPKWIDRVDPIEELDKINSNLKENQLTGSFFIKIKPFRNIELLSRISTHHISLNNSVRKGSVLVGSNEILTRKESGYLSSINTDNLLTWSIGIGRNQFSLVSGLSAISTKGEMTFEQNFGTIAINKSGNLLTDVAEISGNTDNSITSVYFNAQYILNDRFDFLISARQEYLKRFNASLKSLPYPSFSSGYWIISESNHKNDRLLNGVKIKTGWGRTGAVVPLSFNYGDDEQSGYLPVGSEKTYHGVSKKYPDPVFQPEFTEDWNFGLHSLFLKSKLLIDVEYFDRVRSNMAFFAPGILNENNHSFWFNTGKLMQAGFELNLNYHQYFNDFTFDFSFNLTKAKHKILNLNGLVNPLWLVSQRFNGEWPVTVIRNGQQVGSFYGYVVEGIFKNQGEVDAANNLTPGNNTFYQDENTAPGDYKFKDLDWNGYIDENDQTIVGYPNPNITYGLCFNFSYKAFDLSFTGEGSRGNKIYNLNNAEMWATGGFSNRSPRMVNRWSLFNSSAALPRVNLTDPNINSRPNNLMVEDGSYFRIADVRMSYIFMNEEEVNNFTITIGLENPVTFSPYHGDSQATGFRQGRNTAQGLDYGLYPRAATLYFGVKYFF